MKAFDGVLRTACEGLVANWGAHTVLLYGSRADGTETEDSDYDLAAFAPVERTIREASVRMGSYLDLFVYPDSVLHEPTEEHLRLQGSKVLLQRGTEADAFLRRLDDLYQRGPEKLPRDEIEARKVWALKMVSRVRRQDIEGAYRRVWLLTALLEDYFAIRGLWFEGPKKAFRWLDQHDIVAARAFTAALARNAGLEQIHELAMVVITPNDQADKQSCTTPMSSGNEVTSTPEFDTAKSTKTREEVRGELDRARDAGLNIGAGEATPTPEIDTARSGRTREQVRKELDEHIESGQREHDRGETQIGG